MGRIVVGIDGSEHAARALAWAAREAKLRKSTIVLVHSWEFPPPMPDGQGWFAPADVQGIAERIVDDAKATLDDDLVVETEISGETPGHALVHASRGADMLVVGARGRGGFAGLLLGSVSQQVAHHAHCPVVIVRGEPERSR